MNFRKLCFIAILASGAAAAAPDAAAAGPLTEISTGYIPVCSPGIIRHYYIKSPELNANFTVDVWLPDCYESRGEERHPVVYMHDGQNLFDPATSFAGVAWEVDLALGKLIEGDYIHAPIVVGIHNRGDLRPSDYIPEKAATQYIAENDRNASGMWSLVGNKFYGDEYMSFIANTLKPAVDAAFRTLDDAANTFIMGSSMGGLASIYALCEYPDVFGGAACLSTHWIGNFDYGNTIFPSAMIAYLTDALPDAATHRLYLDRGTVDLDSSYDKWEEIVRTLVRSKGYTEEADNLMTYTDNGASHNEIYWAARVDRPLHFMLKSSDKPYTPSDPGEQTFHVIFQDSSKPWTRVNAFTWAMGVTQLGTWPGTKMQEIVYNGQQAWEISFTHKIEPSNIIFNNGSAQTADLDFKNEYVYDFKGPREAISSGIDLPRTTEQTLLRVEGRTLIAETDASRILQVHTVDGRSYSFVLSPGLNTITGLAPGLYISEGRKFIIR
ncbi:MAG: starch-binding protein [Muribaculaceae bacterium]|nr:starch-binding protein [Muribaculaceae bacterium]